MSDARTDVLARVAAAVASSPPVAVPRAYRAAGEHPAGSAELLDLLTDRLVDYKATVRRVGPDEVAAAVAEALADASTCAVPPGLEPGWAAEWTAAGGRLLPDDGPAGPLGTADLDAVDAVLTTARVAVAETGTLVLDGGPGTGRRALTLVPDHHVCVVAAADVVQTVPEAIARLDPRRPLTWVSGPSATSDIELERVEGVHGPRRLDVVLLAP
jgi:L-lactate dehydrogenase complex protein LldG